MISKLKSKSLLFILSAFIGLNATAQRGFNIEVIAQPGLTMGGEYDVPTTDPNNYSNSFTAMKKKITIGLNAGAAASYYFIDKMGVSVGMSYAHQGQNYKDYNYTVSGETWV